MARKRGAAAPYLISQRRAQRHNDIENHDDQTNHPHDKISLTIHPFLQTSRSAGNKRLCLWAAGAAQTCTELHIIVWAARSLQRRIWIRRRSRQLHLHLHDMDANGGGGGGISFEPSFLFSWGRQDISYGIHPDDLGWGSKPLSTTNLPGFFL